jgi:hypothetical protein
VHFTDNGDAALTCFFLFFWMTVMTLIYTDSNNTHACVMLVSFLMIRVLYAACVVSDGKKGEKTRKTFFISMKLALFRTTTCSIQKRKKGNRESPACSWLD